MLDVKEGSVVKCAECRQETTVDYIIDYDGKPGYYLTCKDRNGYCPKCGMLARDVSDTGSEIHVFCDNCFDDSQLFDPFEDQRYPTRRKSNQPDKPPLEEIRKTYPRAYFKWTDDESTAVGLYLNKVPHFKLASLFDREPNSVTVKRSMKNKTPVPEDSSVRFLGKKFHCNSCENETVLTYLRLELIADKRSTRVLDLTIQEIANSSKCKECGKKDFKLVG